MNQYNKDLTLSGSDKDTVEAWLTSEFIVCGSAIRDSACVDAVSDLIGTDDFTNVTIARIWSIIVARHRKSHSVNAQTIYQLIKDDDGLEEYGGPSKLVARLVDVSTTVELARVYAEQMLESQRRYRFNDGLNAAKSDLSLGEDTEEVMARLMGVVQGLPEVRGRETSRSMLTAISDALRMSDDIRKGKRSLLQTGITTLDGIIRGLEPGDLMLLGGTTSMGKTATAIEMVLNASKHGASVFWSLEMTEDQIANRIIAAKSRIPYSDIRNSDTMPDEDYQKWLTAASEIGQGPEATIRIVPKHIRDIAAGTAALRRIKIENGGLSLVVVDYAQLVRADGRSRYEQMTNVSIGLKTMAGILECPVIALVQLNRSIGERDDRRPHLYDIKESGQFENDASQVVFCNREEYWLQRKGPKANRDGKITDEARCDWEADRKRHASKMELIVRKNRHGRLATAEVGFHAPTNRFWKLGDEDPQEDAGF